MLNESSGVSGSVVRGCRMARKKKKQRPARPERPAKPACLEGKWHFGSDVPTYDFFEHRSLDDPADREEIIENVIESLERGEFLVWEAVVCDELGLPLTQKQAKALSGLLDFGDDPGEDRILYIDEIPRPSQLWYEIVREIARHLLVDQFKTHEIHYEGVLEDWNNLVAALEGHGEGLSLPKGAERPVEVVPAELRHRLWLQTCFDQLSGLGQEDELTLKNEEQQDRIQWFVRDLREHKESVEFLDLTLEKLLKVLILPPQDEPILIEMMQKELGLNSMQDKIAERL
jgi:hypothetical protein